MRLRLAVAISGFGLSASVIPMWAHHSVPASYDVSNTITIQGVVTKIEWRNPHARFWVDAKNADGTVSNWELELPALNVLRKDNINMDFVKQGDQVTVNLWRARDGSRLAHCLTLTVPDSRVITFPRDFTKR